MGSIRGLTFGWNQTEQITEFLLVPYVGACIHVPPPLPNQMVYIQPQQALTATGLFAPITVEGQLRSQPATYEVFQVDGTRPVEASYALTLNQLTLSKTSPSPFGPTMAPSVGQLPWWQRLQARASAVLTQAVGNVHHQRSPQTFLWGLLIAFSFGNGFYRRLHQWLKFAGSGCVLLIGLGLFSMTLVSGS